MSRKKYINAYKNVIEFDDQGREKQSIAYLGDYFEVLLDEAEFSRYRTTQLIIFLSTLIVHIALGFLNNAGGRVLYVAVPYAVAFFPFVYWGMGVFRLPSKKQEFRLEHIGLGFDRVKTMSLVVAIIAGIAVLGNIVFLLFFRKGNIWQDIIFLIGEALVLGGAIYARKLSQSVEIRKLERENKALGGEKA